MPLPHALRAPQGCVAALPSAMHSPLPRTGDAIGTGDQGELDGTAAGMRPDPTTRQPPIGSIV